MATNKTAKEKTAEKAAEAEQPVETFEAQISETPAEQEAPKAAEQAAAQENEQLKAMLAQMQQMMASMQQQMAAQAEQIQKMAAGKVKPEKPKTAADLDWERLRAISKQAAEDGKDPWEIDVEVNVPHRGLGEDPWYWIKIGAKSVQIPANDSRQTMALPFAKILVDTIRAAKLAEDYEDSIVAYDPIVNPHKDKL